MFAYLGDIQFQVVGSPEALNSKRGYDFAEQRVLEAAPPLQWLGNDLEHLSLELLFHASFTSPAEQLTALRAAADAHRALALVFGNGEFRGYFVIESIATRASQLSAAGDVIALTALVELKEWVLDAAGAASAAALPGFTPLAVIPAPAASGSTSLQAQGVPSGSLAAAGVSALLNIASAVSLVPSLQPGDIPAAAIVRSTLL